jgi:hypothetical protein
MRGAGRLSTPSWSAGRQEATRSAVTLDREPAPSPSARDDSRHLAGPGNQLMSAIFIEIPGGEEAPRQARRTVLAGLDGHVNPATTSDAGLIISELVTNSVLHAQVGPDQLLTIDVEMMADRLRITVTNPGAERRPRLRAFDPAAPGGFGLRLLEEMCAAWGIVGEAVDTTGVWCDLLLTPTQHPHHARPSADSRSGR